jgi:hypothetical protein
MPFAVDRHGKAKKSDRKSAAFYLADDVQTLIPVQQTERSVSFPTVGLEVSFGPSARCGSRSTACPGHLRRGRFHGNWRAPKASRPIIAVEATEDAMKQLLAAFGMPSLDFAIGEPGQEEVMMQVSTTGSLPFPRVVAAGTRVSVRAPDLAGHDVQVRVSWSDAI